MAVEIITREDLNRFRTRLLDDIRELIQGKSTQNKKWLKSAEVHKLLNISSGTLQNLRISGTLSYTRVGGTMYYDHRDMNKLLNDNKVIAFRNKKPLL